jgi:hypothetical protein
MFHVKHLRHNSAVQSFTVARPPRMRESLHSRRISSKMAGLSRCGISESRPPIAPMPDKAEMGSLIQFKRNRSKSAVASPFTTARNYPGAAARSHLGAPARNYEDESWKSLLVLVVVFTFTAIAMSVSVVLAGSNTWAEAVRLIVLVVVFALTKIFLANALFYVMIRSDAYSEAVAAAAAQSKADGLVLRRPRTPPGFNGPKIAGARPRKGASASNVRLAVLTRKPANPPPRRTDR